MNRPENDVPQPAPKREGSRKALPRGIEIELMPAGHRFDPEEHMTAGDPKSHNRWQCEYLWRRRAHRNYAGVPKGSTDAAE